jgi:hypothetical protein
LLENIKTRIAESLLYSELLVEARARLESEAYRAGVARGENQRQKAIEQRLKEHSLADFKDKKLVLGYSQAVAVVTGDVK